MIIGKDKQNKTRRQGKKKAWKRRMRTERVKRTGQVSLSKGGDGKSL